MTAIFAVIIDQVSKAVVRSFLPVGRSVEVIPGWFSLRLVENPGAAFGALGSWPPILILIGLAAIVAIVGMRKERSKSRELAIALGLLLGGAVGNLIDRLISGHVTDFLDFGVTFGGEFHSWPTFNLADVAITAGVLLLAYHILVVEGRASGEEKVSAARNKN